MLDAILAIQTHPEAEDLRAVRFGTHDREAEVERDRHRAHHRHRDAQAEAGGDAEVVNAGLALHGASVEEGHEVEIIVGANRDLILNAAQDLELAADHEAVGRWADAAEFEAANAGVTAAEEAFIDGHLATAPGRLAVQHDHVLAGTIGPLPGREVAAHFGVQDRVRVAAENVL